jgi:hypothetical protein
MSSSSWWWDKDEDERILRERVARLEAENRELARRRRYFGPSNNVILFPSGEPGRAPTPKITVAAVKLFERMRRLVCCTCEPSECRHCHRWWDLYAELHKELGARLWQWPCIEDPETRNPYRSGSSAYHSWQPDLEAQELWKALASASRELQRVRRAAAKVRKAAAATSPLPSPLSSPNNAPGQPPPAGGG